MLVHTAALPELLLLVVVLLLEAPPPIPLVLDDVVVMPVLLDAEVVPPMALAELVLVDGLVDPPVELPPPPPLLPPQATAAINTVPAPPMKRIRRMVLPSVIGCSDPLMRPGPATGGPRPREVTIPCGAPSLRCAAHIAPMRADHRELGEEPWRRAACSSALSLLRRSLDDRRALDDP
jgi:hypothetical protein